MFKGELKTHLLEYRDGKKYFKQDGQETMKEKLLI